MALTLQDLAGLVEDYLTSTDDGTAKILGDALEELGRTAAAALLRQKAVPVHVAWGDPEAISEMVLDEVGLESDSLTSDQLRSLASDRVTAYQFNTEREAQAFIRALVEHDGWQGCYYGHSQADVVDGIIEDLRPYGDDTD